ncbi:MAG: cytochrome c3 family protein [Desulfuromonadaceae bacterium]|nr:cytochrome c3 family protein [Desulfuromonadaceae bacterium]
MKVIKGSFMLGVLVLLFSSVCFAGEGPEIIILHASKGDVDFTHWQHQTDLGDDCSKCHADEPGKITELGRDWAHNTCLGCHLKAPIGSKKGPTLCFGCHNKPK